MNKIVITVLIVMIGFPGNLFAGPPDLSPQLEEIFSIQMASGWNESPLVFTPDGNRIIRTERENKLVHIWDAWTGKNIASYGPYNNLSGTICAISPDGKQLAIGLSDRIIGFLDLNNGSITKQIDIQDIEGSLQTAAFSPRGDIIATGTYSGKTLKIWDAVDGSFITSFGGSINYLAFNPSGELLVFDGGYKGIDGNHIWNIDTNSLIKSFPYSTFKPTFSPDGRHLALGNASNIELWDTRTWTLAKSIHFSIGVVVDFSPDGHYMALRTTRRFLIIWDKLWDKERGHIGKTLSDIRFAVFSPDGTRIAVVTQDQKILMCNANVTWSNPMGGEDIQSPDGRVREFKASSALTDSNIADRYSADKAFDGDPMTSWVEGKNNAGVGEYIKVIFDQEITIDAIEIMPGYFDERYWIKNNRVKNLDIQTENSYFSLDFRDTMEPQKTPLNREYSFKEITLKITDVYKGTSWDDTCIAEIAFYWNGQKIDLKPPSQNSSDSIIGDIGPAGGIIFYESEGM